MTDDPSTITPQDVADLNRQTVERAAWISRIVGAALIVVGIVGALAWCWTTARTQQRFGPIFFSGDGSGNSSSLGAADRIDLFMNTIGLLLSAALVAGLGLAMRLAADYTQTRVGASVTGYQVGDVIDDLNG